ncbi:ABC transporter substrate-binding protein [Nocardioides sp. SYSU DS0663]|uniref:ABC transporter substrate-binding protein n=1 Tax=Nocardioides sp. SYSU DS0663 TaxID=3416445 RepID=UPI003F4CA37B
MHLSTRKPGAFVAALGLTSMLALSACSSDSEAAADGDALTPVNMAFEWTCAGDWSVVYSGLEQGIFEEHGIDLSYDRGQGGSDTVPLVAAGEFDLGILSAAPVAIGAGQDLPLTVIGAASTVGPVTILADPSITSPEDLEGKSLAVQTDQFEGAVWQAFVSATGIDESTIDVIPSDDATQAEFLAGDIDAFVIFYPTTSTEAILTERPDLTVMPMQDHVPTYGHVFTANDAWLAENEEAAQGFTTAWAESAKWVVDNYDAAYETLVEECQEVSPEALKFSMDAYFEGYTAGTSAEDGLGSLRTEGLAETQSVLVESGLAEPVDVEEWVSDDYLPEPAVLP